MATFIRMPEVLANSDEAAIQTWLVNLGDKITVGVPLAEVETEKATVEYAAEAEGTVLRLLVPAGQPVSVGTPIAVLGAEGEVIDEEILGGPPAVAPVAEGAMDQSNDVTAPAVPVLDPHTPTGVPSPEQQETAPEKVNSARRFVSPLVRRLAKERDLNLSKVVGTGPGGRVVRRDIEGLTAEVSPDAHPASAPDGSTSAADESRMNPAAAPSTHESTTEAGAAAGDVDVAHTAMRRAIARRLTLSKSTVPHFYLVADCRVDQLVALRKTVNNSGSIKVSLNDFVVKAAAGAFGDVPEANATWGEAAIRRHAAVDISVAVGIDGGLLTPVVRSASTLSLTEISRSVADLAARAKEGKLRQPELEGGSFTISNLGMYGVTEFTAIINPPQSAILAVGRARQVPVVSNGAIEVGTVMTVTLSADHRVLDGVLAAQWLAAFVKRIEDPLTILI